MRRRLLITTAAAGAALLTLTACGASGNQAGSSTTVARSSGASSSPAATSAHNGEDVMFAQHMIAHHQQAIQMSDIIQAKQGIDARVIDLANQIKAAQGPEIQQMQTWLTQWGQPTTMPSSMPSESTMPGMPSHSSMPGMTGTEGMMSEQDMRALQNAQGVDASKLFLTQMIQHHQGAITMAQNEIKSGQYSPAIGLAHSVVTNQQQEITTMQTILNSL
ncbi:DUF305 domain-containing protein [Mycobacterium szulgai]|nr:DUF305 domain-containing protein [Mycobacterium szulgai]